MVLSSTPRRVVITGLGLVTPLGNTVASTWESLIAGRSGVSLIEHFDTAHFATKICAPVKGYDSSSVMSSKEARKYALFIQYALTAAAEAFSDAAIEMNESLASRVGVCIGSGIGGLGSIEDNANVLTRSGPKRVSPLFVPGSIINSASGAVSMKFGLRGPNLSVVTACASATHSLAVAAQQIANGYADIMLSGGSEMAICPLGIAGFSALKALSTRNDAPEQASRPWDKARDGFVLGDGAGILVLESLESATSRGATIYAEITGMGLSGDAHHIVAPDESAVGASQCMRQALQDAKLQPSDIDYINAHATSTPIGDAAEVTAIQSVFQDAMDVTVGSTKSMHGHLLGAAGAVEAAICALAIHHQMIPPTINLDQPDDGFNLNFVTGKPLKKKVNVCMSNSFGFGGTNGCLILQKMS